MVHVTFHQNPQRKTVYKLNIKHKQYTKILQKYSKIHKIKGITILNTQNQVPIVIVINKTVNGAGRTESQKERKLKLRT